MDLHLHTPASVDYQEPGVSPLQILQRAEARGLDIVAFTDHNSVRGYADLWREVEDLELLEFLGRLQPAEGERLAEYRRLLGKILLLPGFEFTATLGFHILAIFPEGTSVRKIEHLLLLLGVPEDRLGSGEVGATTDVLRTYEVLADHGALVIGAHVNSSHGIAMQGLRFGGQTKIAYTQDPHLHALEVTDLAIGNHRRSTARFFSGIKPEYPRPMHCIQGSDAHRLERDPARETNLGVGDRATEVLLPEVSFAALRALFASDEFGRVRPYVPQDAVVDLVRAARAEGNTVEQAFHESLTTKKTGYAHVLRDLVAFANGEGGTVYVGASAFEKRPTVGVPDAEAAGEALLREVEEGITPVPAAEVEILVSDEKEVLAVRVPAGTERPYALGAGGIYVRQEGESVAASRDQIVAMVRAAASARPAEPEAPAPAFVPPPAPAPRAEPGERRRDERAGPRERRSERNGRRPDAPGPNGHAAGPADEPTEEVAARRREPSRRDEGRRDPERRDPERRDPERRGDDRRTADRRPPERRDADRRDDDRPFREERRAAEPIDRRPARGRGDDGPTPGRRLAPSPARAAAPAAATAAPRLEEFEEDAPGDDFSPASGVEVLDGYEQDGVVYYSLRDLRHLRFVHNVTRETGKRLWRYAIGQHEDRPTDERDVRWRGDRGYVGSYRPRSGERRYNLAWRGDGDLRVFYGVGEDDLDDDWWDVIPRRED